LTAPIDGANRSDTAQATPGPPAGPGVGPDSRRAPELPEAVRARLPELDEGALATFFDHYFDRVYAYLRRLVRSEHVAEDLAQDVFLHLHRALPSYDPARPLGPWVFTIASNKLRDHWRSRRTHEDRRALRVDDDEAGVELEGDGAAPDGALVADEEASEVAAAVAALPEMLQQTFNLRYHEGLSFAEIGEIVDRNETAVRKRYSRALGELRDALAHLRGS